MSTGESETSGKPLPPEVEARVQAIVEETLARFQRGETVDIAKLAAENPELLPALEKRLNFVQRLFRMATAFRDPLGDSAEVTRGLDAGGNGQRIAERAWRLPCPHCGTEIQVVQPLTEDVTCKVCGSTIHLDSGKTQTLIGSRHVKRLGRFEVLDVLGQGGFGLVYKARDTELGRIVALKVPRLGYFLSNEDEQRFMREARHAARLRHPAIVPVFEVGREQEIPFIVSEFIDGLTLADLISHQRIPFRQAAELIVAISQALEHAHSEGVIHRDIKPGNILLDHQHRPYVTDFGLARSHEGEFTITLEGEVIGTPTYMSPEQVAGDQHLVDRRSDVYSLGVLMYRLLTGELPFRGSKRLVLHQVLHDEPRAPRSLNEFIARDLETITLKAMMKDPHRRYSTAKELADDLRRWLNGETILARPAGRIERLSRWCRRNRVVASLGALIFALLVLAGAVAAAWGWREHQVAGTLRTAWENEAREHKRADENARMSQQRLARSFVSRGVSSMRAGDYLGSLPWLVAGMQLESHLPEREYVNRLRLNAVLAHCPRLADLHVGESSASAVAISPDGRRVASGFRDGTVMLWELATGNSVVTLRHSAPVWQLAFDPEGKRLGTASLDHTGQVWDVQNGARVGRPLTHTNFVYYIAFSPDGRRVVTASRDATACVWDATTGDKILTLTHPQTVKKAKFTPQADRIVTAEWEFFNEPSRIHIWTLDGDMPRDRVIELPSHHQDCVFSDDGTRLLTSSGKQARIWNVAEGEPLTPPIEHESEIRGAWFVEGGSRILTVTTTGMLRYTSADTGQGVGDLILTGESVSTADLSEDGKRLGIASMDQGAVVWQLDPPRPLTPPLPHTNRIMAMKIAQSGQSAVTAGDDGIVKTWDLRTYEQTGPRLKHDQGVVRVRVNASGSMFASTSRDGKVALWSIADRSETGPRLVHPHQVSDASFSPDGQRIATACLDGNVREWDLRTRTVIGMPLHVGEFAVHVQYDPTSRLLAGSDASGKLKLWERDRGHLRFEVSHQDRIEAITFSPDGQLLATAGRDGMAWLWRVSDGQAASPPMEHANHNIVIRCRFSPDGKYLLTCGRDHTARLWEVATGRAAGSPVAHRGSVWDVAFHPRGKSFLTAGNDGEVIVWDGLIDPTRSQSMSTFGMNMISATFDDEGRFVLTASNFPVSWESRRLFGHGAAQLWDVQTGEWITPLLRHDVSLSNVASTPDKTWIATSDDVGTVRFWHFVPQTDSAEELERLSRLLSGQQIDRQGQSVPVPPAELQVLFKR